ncbi:MAG TPA: toxin TcdB middle/N-terminal domain-containing protein, partial [Caldilineaceae bacterium]|nr:toxin TcdB middle/N-terminal domain-containing protein [Caldilineaceae bacterium]
MHIDIRPQDALTPVLNLPASQNPARVYLASLSSGSHRTMLGALNLSAAVLSLGRCDHHTLPWWLLRKAHTNALRAWLAQNRSAATGNKTLSAVRGTLRAAWDLDQIDTDAYMRAISIKAISGSRPEQAAGRALAPGEFTALLRVGAEEHSAAGVRDGQVVLWEHNGNGSYEAPHPILNPPSGLGAQELLMQMGDLNNDGLIDLVLPGNHQVTYWLSLGDGSLTDAIVIPDTPAFDAQQTAVRLADIDGDGATELLFSSAEGMAYVDFSTGEQPFLLRSVDNGLGRTIQISYKSSIADYIADWEANNPWQVNLPFPVQVVKQVTVHDANSGDDYTIDYHYRDGFYEGVQKEFRGFVRSQETKRGDESAATTVTNNVYDVGMADESHKGMMLESEVLAEGGQCAGDFSGCLQRTVNQLTTRVVVAADQTHTGKPIAYAFVSQTDSFVHEQTATPIHLRQSFAQDDYGNQTQEFNFGQVCGEDVTCGNDEILTYTDYIYDQDRYIFDRPLRVRQTDAAGNLVSEARMYYDGEAYVGLPAGQLTRGDLTRKEENLGPNGNNRLVQTKRQQFDQWGNLIGIMDGNGHITTVAYDPLQHTFPVLERIHFADGGSPLGALSYAATYHMGFG